MTVCGSRTALTLSTLSPCSPMPSFLPILPSGTDWSGLMVASSTDEFERTRRLKKPCLECSFGTDSSGGGRRREMTFHRRRAENKGGERKPGDGDGIDCCEDYKCSLSVLVP
ncbi:hypothetical protein BDR05DRAFT_181168 [Suillus weaverae]|nr:hypothetical protein BDR05DRAFT_181168 [Suillus weaverae]